MSTDPDAIRADIERTRRRLSNDVNLLTNEANPKTIIGRRVDKARSAVGSIWEKIIGAASDPRSSLGLAKPSATSSASDSDAIGSVSQKVRAQTQRNPLVVVVIAFGVGALVGSLFRPRPRKDR